MKIHNRTLSNKENVNIEKGEFVDISVVMPVYNTGEYLRQSLTCLINQTFTNFELICIDDASTDKKTKQILKEYENKSDKIHIIYLKSNVGAAEARNIGLLEASGNYIMFLDADDLFDACMLEMMYHKIQDTSSEVCICGYERFYFENGIKNYSVEKSRTYDKNNLKEDWLLYNSPNPWTKLCKKSFLIENSILFQSIPACNDVYWSCFVQIKAKKVCFIEDRQFVSYRACNPRQISANKSVLCIYYAMAEVLKKVVEDQMEDDILKSVILLFIWLEVGEIRRAKKNNEARHCHFLTRKILVEYVKDIVYQSEFYNGLLYSFMLPDFIEKRFPISMSFLEQLNLSREKIMMSLHNATHIVLWGNGKRGEAFQQFCNNYGIELMGVTDIKNECIGLITPYGNRIISTKIALFQADLIIASNLSIFQELKRKIDDEVNCLIFNLQEYCPLN